MATPPPGYPAFLLDVPLAALTAWRLRLDCCGRVRHMPLDFAAQRRARTRFGDLLAKLRCQSCGKRPRRVVLVDSLDSLNWKVPFGARWEITIQMPDSERRET